MGYPLRPSELSRAPRCSETTASLTLRSPVTKSRCVRAGLALVASLVAAPAHAQVEPVVSLEWNAPPSCPDRDAVLARISADASGASKPVAGFSAHADV